MPFLSTVLDISVFFSVDITAYHRGFHGDLNETLFVGDVSDSSKDLVKTTYECLTFAIENGNLIYFALLLFFYCCYYCCHYCYCCQCFYYSVISFF